MCLGGSHAVRALRSLLSVSILVYREPWKWAFVSSRLTPFWRTWASVGDKGLILLVQS